MKTIELTYRCLLADASRISGFSEIRGLGCDLSWCLKEAPLLEKLILDTIEQCYEVLPDSVIQQFPVALQRLAAASILDANMLRVLRQLLLFCYKASVPHESKTTAAAYAAFTRTNQEVSGYDHHKMVDPELLCEVRRHIQSVLYWCEWDNFVPSHGPGASTTSKWSWTSWYSSIDEVWPYFPNFLLNEDHCGERDIPINDSITSKVCAVPKDSRGPRLVCVHPAEAIWAQQGVRRILEDSIESPRRRSQGYPWPYGHIVFNDQSINGSIALHSSASRRYATIDLSEASDRLSEGLIKYLFGRYYKYFGCSRAQFYILPGDEPRRMYCYAPMGNATVFPVQSLVFWAICVASMQVSGLKNPGSCFVFGDDIIVPSAIAPKVCEDLESFGLRVNRRKTFIHGFFRESCGVDAYRGVNVTPIRWKTVPSPTGLVELVATSDLAMRLRIAGYEEAASRLYTDIRHVMLSRYGKRLFFTNNPLHGGIAEYVDSAYHAFSDSKWSRRWQWYYTVVYNVKPVGEFSSRRGWNHVLDSLTSLERSGSGASRPELVSRRVRLTREWTPVL